jgi:hypothetical protein
MSADSIMRTGRYLFFCPLKAETRAEDGGGERGTEEISGRADCGDPSGARARAEQSKDISDLGYIQPRRGRVRTDERRGEGLARPDIMAITNVIY